MSPQPDRKARPILVDFWLPNFAVIAWFVSLSVLVSILYFRAAQPQSYNVAVVDTERVFITARKYVREKGEFPELVEIELIKFAELVQTELDVLIEEKDVDLVISDNIIIGGEAIDYTDYIFVHARDRFDLYLEEEKTKKAQQRLAASGNGLDVTVFGQGGPNE